jgi:hypothetical protein
MPKFRKHQKYCEILISIAQKKNDKKDDNGPGQPLPISAAKPAGHGVRDGHKDSIEQSCANQSQGAAVEDESAVMLVRSGACCWGHLCVVF